MERILIVEDDQAVQKALKRLFEAEGYNVEISGDAADTGADVIHGRGLRVLYLLRGRRAGGGEGAQLWFAKVRCCWLQKRCLGMTLVVSG